MLSMLSLTAFSERKGSLVCTLLVLKDRSSSSPDQESPKHVRIYCSISQVVKNGHACFVIQRSPVQCYSYVSVEEEGPAKRLMQLTVFQQ